MRAEDKRDPAVDRPDHYDGDECMKVLELVGWGREGCLFNIGKYLWRMGGKGKPVQDAQKALWYATRFKENAGYANGRGLNPKEHETIEACVSRGCEALTDETVQEVARVVNRIRDMLTMTGGH